MILLVTLAQVSLDPTQVEKLGIIGLLATGWVVLGVVVKMLWAEIIRLRLRYDELLETTHAHIAANTAQLAALKEQIDIYPALQRLEDKLGDASHIPGRTVRK